MRTVRSPVLPLPVPDDDHGELQHALHGDQGAFRALVQRLNPAMFRACRAILRDDSEAEDAVQSAWLSAYRGLAGFRGEASFRTWVTRIAVHEAFARLRRRPTALMSELDRALPVASPEDLVASAELLRLLERKLDALPGALRVVLVLRDVLELDTGETAACLQIDEGNVRVRLHRARQALARELETHPGLLAEVWRFDGQRCARIWGRVARGLGWAGLS